MTHPGDTSGGPAAAEADFDADPALDAVLWEAAAAEPAGDLTAPGSPDPATLEPKPEDPGGGDGDSNGEALARLGLGRVDQILF